MQWIKLLFVMLCSLSEHLESILRKAETMPIAQDGREQNMEVSLCVYMCVYFYLVPNTVHMCYLMLIFF